MLSPIFFLGVLLNWEGDPVSATISLNIVSTHLHTHTHNPEWGGHTIEL